MPLSAPSRCSQRCGKLATSKGRCDDHQRAAWENPSANSRALTSTERARIHKQQIKREPHCRVCNSTEHLRADHITEIADGGSLFDASNLQTLCDDCHGIKTNAARALRAAQRRLTRG
ncbi:HNH endonuclease signature motif containing protein [Arthrobacter sp. UYCu712]|uniref:HNH endonuclease signature motif containing protein n=1 Tax=Arthrobacter sp. UYCu712 TaxID=3156340 RepID=UPI003391C22D